MRLAVLLLALLLTATGAQAQRRPTLPDLAYGAHERHRLDVYLPARTAGPAPVIVMMHGGAWVLGDKRNRNVWRAKARHWVPRGYAFVSVNTRLLPDAQPLDQARDLARALAFVQARAAGWGADPERIVLMGHSAGAHTAALLAADPRLGSEAGLKPWRGTVALDTAVLDVADLMRSDPAWFHFNAFGRDPNGWDDASPMARMGGRPGPILAVCSLQRPGVCERARRFAGAATARGGAAQVLPVDLSHEEINADLGLRNGYTAAVDAWLRGLGLP